MNMQEFDQILDDMCDAVNPVMGFFLAMPKGKQRDQLGQSFQNIREVYRRLQAFQETMEIEKTRNQDKNQGKMSTAAKRRQRRKKVQARKAQEAHSINSS